MSIFSKFFYKHNEKNVEDSITPEEYFENLYQEKKLEDAKTKKWVEENVKKFLFLEKYGITVHKSDFEIIISGESYYSYPFTYKYYIKPPVREKGEIFTVDLEEYDNTWHDKKVKNFYGLTMKALLLSIFNKFDIKKDE